jgi:hypothetical protein
VGLRTFCNYMKQVNWLSIWKASPGTLVLSGPVMVAVTRGLFPTSTVMAAAIFSHKSWVVRAMVELFG